MVCDIGRNGDPFEGGQTVLRYNVEHRSNGDVYLAVTRHVFAALVHQPGKVGPRFSVSGGRLAGEAMKASEDSGFRIAVEARAEIL